MAKRAKIVATGEWETAIRGIANPLESLAAYSGVTALPVEEKMFIRMRERQVAIERLKEIYPGFVFGRNTPGGYFLPFAFLWYKDRWLQCTENVYYPIYLLHHLCFIVLRMAVRL